MLRLNRREGLARFREDMRILGQDYKRKSLSPLTTLCFKFNNEPLTSISLVFCYLVRFRRIGVFKSGFVTWFQKYKAISIFATFD